MSNSQRLLLVTNFRCAFLSFSGSGTIHGICAGPLSTAASGILATRAFATSGNLGQKQFQLLKNCRYFTQLRHRSNVLPHQHDLASFNRHRSSWSYLSISPATLTRATNVFWHPPKALQHQLCQSSASLVTLSRACSSQSFGSGSQSPSSASAPSSSSEGFSSAKNEASEDEGVEVVYFRGLPQITIPLPSRRERCRFILKPLTNTVGDLQHMITHEDRGVDRIAVLSTDGVRIASSNTIEMLMEHDFDIILNEKMYRVITPTQEKASKEDLERLSSVRNLVGQLYAALNIDEHQLRHEREMVTELEKLLGEIGPMEDKRETLTQIASKQTNWLTWAGLGLMSVQFGVLARLTWWEYSWDIMEPVTYFVTYGTAVLAYAYFVLTKQEYILPDVRDRQYLITFHKNARKIGLDVERYNQLRDQIHKIDTDLRRLRDPLALHLPLRTRLAANGEIEKLHAESSHSIMSKASQKIQSIFKKSTPKEV